MDAIDVAILALRLGLVLVLYLFLVVVVRTAAATLRPPAQPAQRPGTSVDGLRSRDQTEPLRLVVLEPGGSDLGLGDVLVVEDGATLGRTERATVTLADPAVSSEHVRLARVGTEWVVIDLGSTNGTLLNQGMVQGEAVVGPGDVLGLGNVRLKVLER